MFTKGRLSGTSTFPCFVKEMQFCHEKWFVEHVFAKNMTQFTLNFCEKEDKSRNFGCFRSCTKRGLNSESFAGLSHTIKSQYWQTIRKTSQRNPINLRRDGVILGSDETFCFPVQVNYRLRIVARSSLPKCPQWYSCSKAKQTVNMVFPFIISFQAGIWNSTWNQF